MTAAFSHHMFTTIRSAATIAVVVQFASLLRPGELSSLTWEDVLFPADLRLQPYGDSTTGILIRSAKTAQHIVQKKFIPVACPAAITLLTDFRTQSNNTMQGFHYLRYDRYRLAFQNALTFLEIPSAKISFHGARGSFAFLAHQKGQKADQTVLLGRWRSPASIPHYLDNAKASIGSILLGANTHRKL